MPSFINSMMKKIWKKMSRKAYRDGYVSAHVSNTIAAQITQLRTARGWTQTQLADRTGMKQSRISALEDPNWENVEVATLLRFASAFDVALTARFAPFSELAEWAATLSDHKLLVPSYEEEAAENAAARTIAVEGNAEAAFFQAFTEQRISHGAVLNAIRNIRHVNLAPLAKDDAEWSQGAMAFAAGVPLPNEFSGHLPT